MSDDLVGTSKSISSLLAPFIALLTIAGFIATAVGIIVPGVAQVAIIVFIVFFLTGILVGVLVLLSSWRTKRLGKLRQSLAPQLACSSELAAIGS